jgi:hypothetical protein
VGAAAGPETAAGELPDLLSLQEEPGVAPTDRLVPQEIRGELPPDPGPG